MDAVQKREIAIIDLIIGFGLILPFAIMRFEKVVLILLWCVSDSAILHVAH